MTQQNPSAPEPGFDTNLDFSRDTIEPDEAEALLKWYVESHGEGNVDLTSFVPFLIAQRPAALKRYRAYAQAIHESSGLPQLAIALMFLHYYALIGNHNGVLYEVIAARKWGATKREVVDTIELTFLEGGPFSINTAADSSWEYLNAWSEDDEREVADPWPAGWEPSPDEARSLRWSDSCESFLAARAPRLHETLAARYDQTHGTSSLPTRFIPLLHLHAAAIRGQADAARRAALTARSVGATADEALGTLGFAFLYTAPPVIETLVDAVGDVFDGWS
jgi:alkylhydroperoxidase/carboxymuconolactone decarboxylase family protein YurZ